MARKTASWGKQIRKPACHIHTRTFINTYIHMYTKGGEKEQRKEIYNSKDLYVSDPEKQGCNQYLQYFGLHVEHVALTHIY